jgi:hypothetical protein
MLRSHRRRRTVGCAVESLNLTLRPNSCFADLNMVVIPILSGLLSLPSTRVGAACEWVVDTGNGRLRHA